RQQDVKGATAAWAELAREESQSLQPHLQLFNLALQAGDGKRAEEQIAEVGKIDEQYAHLCRAQFLVWQARNEEAAVKQKARDEARGILNELRVRRPDLAMVPLALARLDEDELAVAGDDAAKKKEKLESAITLYRRAIELGHRDTNVA